jgi:hypothetical protein
MSFTSDLDLYLQIPISPAITAPNDIKENKGFVIPFVADSIKPVNNGKAIDRKIIVITIFIITRIVVFIISCFLFVKFLKLGGVF